MTVHVKLFSTLVKLSATQKPEFEIEHRPGMTVGDIVRAEGFRERDAEAVAAVVNNEQRDFETVLQDGDRVELLVNIQGGSPGRGT